MPEIVLIKLLLIGCDVCGYCPRRTQVQVTTILRFAKTYL
jgi:hypothetical protein